MIFLGSVAIELAILGFGRKTPRWLVSWKHEIGGKLREGKTYRYQHLFLQERLDGIYEIVNKRIVTRAVRLTRHRHRDQLGAFGS